MSEQPVDQQGTPSGHQPEIYDPPIEHDPIGQALVGLPVAFATGLGEAAVEGADLVGELGKEVISWGAAELGIGAGEHLLDGSGTDGANPADASDNGQDGPDASAAGQSAPADQGAPGDQGAPDDAGTASQSMPDDGGVCEDPGYTPADMPAE